MHSEGKVSNGSIAAYMFNPNGDNRFGIRIEPGCNCTACRPNRAESVELESNIRRIAALWNAADGMTTEEAVKYIKHGREMQSLLFASRLSDNMSEKLKYEIDVMIDKLEGNNG